MNDVATRLTQQYFGASRNNQLTRGNNRFRDSVFSLHWIVVFPPPLLTCDVDNHFRVIGLCKIKHRAECEHTNNGQNECGNNRQRDFQRRVAVRLMWNWLTFVAELNNRHDHCDGNDDTNNSCYRENWLL